MFPTPDPLHPALVHLPLGLAIVLPLFALATALLVARGALPVRAWGFVFALHVLLVGGGWAAMETGEQEEERVEEILSHDVIHEHAERAELFVQVAALLLVVTGAGLLGGSVGGVARGASVVAAALVLVLAVRAGELGGKLVYEHGAADAYREKPAASGAPPPLAPPRPAAE